MLALAPRHPQAGANLGNALAQLGQFAEAAQAYESALKITPGALGVHLNHGNVLRELGRTSDAVASYREALRLNPSYAEAAINLGFALLQAGRLDEALQSYQLAVRLAPSFAEGHQNIAIILERQGKLAEALAANETARTLRPDLLEAWCTLGDIRMRQARPDAAAEAFGTALALHPDAPRPLRGLVGVQNYLETATPERTLALARRYAATLSPLVVPHATNSDPGKRLRVGLVSGDLRDHAVAQFLIPALGAPVEFVAYSNNVRDDAVTARLRELIPVWRDVRDLADEALAALIRADAIDILIDLAGYTDSSRLEVFARRPAPVQVGWLGYSGTTGLPAMDYILADRWVAPPGAEAEFSETPWRLPDSYLCFANPAAPLPARSDGPFTFGSFNNLAKLIDRTISTWSKLLISLPESRLLIKSSMGGDAARFDEMRSAFSAEGVNPGRVEFLERVADRAAHLALYGRIDIALDPLPYNGTTTTCEALWMGVPVLTLRGQSFVSRVGESLLRTIGLDDWIAADPDEYVAKASAFATDLESLASLRQSLRGRLAASPLGDAPAFARNFETALRGMWLARCAAIG